MDGQVDTNVPLTIGEVIRRTGVRASALHFYERKGLIFSSRDGTNQRIYARHMLRRISLIIIAKRLGVPLSDLVAVFAELPSDRAPTHEDWQHMSRSWRRQLQERRRILENLEHELTGCIGCGCLSMKACALLNPDDTLQREGPGPVRLQRPPEPQVRTGRQD
ncbi:redox-sensitive transcriptional activator SoxR [Kribbella shirazensis]|uniref:MerR family redox-sensitive transcriptional activator SoxR n=1 Tax=Kribbella shirazensis TaxID=1105143 RepID=A0A7X5VIT3_9ACTN|nr:redox-sensitive transcriptional activator SoxR [Kribbella shirazensis]NIK61993.1 MerR family redox-sensitive transcriptional activator SoxR [Kribbella shirazensis]